MWQTRGIRLNPILDEIAAHQKLTNAFNSLTVPMCNFGQDLDKYL